MGRRQFPAESSPRQCGADHNSSYLTSEELLGRVAHLARLLCHIAASANSLALVPAGVLRGGEAVGRRRRAAGGI